MSIRGDYAGLIIDVGVSEGNDSAFYLAKGFRVIAVEADAATCARLRHRFADQISSGAFRLLPFAASDSFGTPVDFFVHQAHQGISGLTRHTVPELASGYVHQVALTVDWNTLVAQQGIPRYLKIDVEGNEEAFLRGMADSSPLPEFISVECHLLAPVEQLYMLGYRRFRLVDQNPPGGFRLPSRQIEGVAVLEPDFRHASGPFGLDLFGDGQWLEINQMRHAWTESQQQRGRTWFDCHAWLPN